MREGLRGTLVRVAALGALFVLAFVVFAYVTFPWERVRDHLVAHVGRALPGHELEIDELGPTWGLGMSADGVRLRQTETTPDVPPGEVTFESLEVTLSLLALVSGDLGMGFSAEVGGGAIEGELSSRDEVFTVQASLEEVDLRAITLLRSRLGLPMGGVVTGTIDLTLAKEPAKTEGSATLRIAELSLGDGRAKLKLPGMADGVTIERVDAGTLELELKVESGVAQIARLEAHGPDLELGASGTVRLGASLDATRLDLLAHVKFTEAYRTRNDRTQAIFSLMELNPQVRRARRDDGALQYRIVGPPGARLQARPAASERPARGAKAAAATPRPRPASDDEE